MGMAGGSFCIFGRAVAWSGIAGGRWLPAKKALTAPTTRIRGRVGARSTRNPVTRIFGRRLCFSGNPTGKSTPE